MPEDNDKTYLMHILDLSGEIKEYVDRGGRSLFDLDSAIRNAIIRDLEVIGEACRNISESFRIKHKEVPWKEIIGTRDRLIHDYMGVDLEKVWEMATVDVPDLQKQVQAILKTEE
jgi:uncharacterized protein with HEPN domain